MPQSTDKQKDSQTTIIVGTGYGDEGKGKVIDVLSSQFDVVCRGQGGANAGHTFTFKGQEVNTHQLPSGITNKSTLNIMGHGMYLDPVSLLQEIATVRNIGLEISPKNLAISTTAHVVFPKHKFLDAHRENSKDGQGSTKSGISFVASDKVLRTGIRAHDFAKSVKELTSIAYDGLRQAAIQCGVIIDSKTEALFKDQAKDFAKAAKEIEPYLTNTKILVRKKLASNKNILLEGAQAFGLDINHGKYPFVTSSETTASGVATGVGLNHRQIGKVIGVVKAIPSKVGGGPFVTKITDEKIASLYRGKMQNVDGEFGKTTKRPRDIGYMDLVLLKEAVAVNGIDEIALTKADVLNRESLTCIAVAYELDGVEINTLPDSANQLSRCQPIYKKMPTGANINGITEFNKLNQEIKNIIEFIEKFVGVPITIIGTGPAGNETIIR